MKRKHTSVADCELRFVLITLDNHVTDSVQRAATKIRREAPGVHVAMHATASWGSDPSALERCLDDIAHGDIIVVTMLFMEDQIKALLPALQARRDHCDAMICCMSAAEVMKLTRMGRFTMDGEAKGPVALLKRLRGKTGKAKSSAGAQQMTVLRQLPKILRFIPGTAQDVRVYFLTLQYWLASSDENLRRMMANSSTATPPASARPCAASSAPAHRWSTRSRPLRPGAQGTDFRACRDLPRPRKNEVGTVGVLIMRSYALAGNSAHYDRLIATLRERGLRVITAFASGLDARPAVEKYFIDKHGKPVIDALLSLTGFSLVGGPAYNDTARQKKCSASWTCPTSPPTPSSSRASSSGSSTNGLMPVEATMMVAIPELDGATQPTVFGGRSDKAPTGAARASTPCSAHPERIDALAARIEKLVALRSTAARAASRGMVCSISRRTPATPAPRPTLAVFQSLYQHPARRLKARATTSTSRTTSMPCASASSRATQRSTAPMANVHTHPGGRPRAREPHLAEIEAQWGPVPGKQLTDGRSLFVWARSSATSSSACSRASATRATRCGCCSSAASRPTHAFSGLLSLDPRGLRRPRRAALRHPRCAGVHARQAGGHVRALLAAAADRRSAALLPVRGEQSLRGHHRQAPRRRHPDQLPDAADHPRGPLQGPAGTQESIERWRAQQDEDETRSATSSPP
jgi:magnesium chelatase subunit H